MVVVLPDGDSSCLLPRLTGTIPQRERDEIKPTELPTICTVLEDRRKLNAFLDAPFSKAVNKAIGTEKCHGCSIGHKLHLDIPNVDM